jgi:hypothetical protein
LEDHADFLAAQQGTRIIVQLREFLASDPDRAGIRPVKTADQV